jgi:hypothetical protein
VHANEWLSCSVTGGDAVGEGQHAPTWKGVATGGELVLLFEHAGERAEVDQRAPSFRFGNRIFSTTESPGRRE